MKVPKISRSVVVACVIVAFGTPAIADKNDDAPGWWSWGMHQMMGRMGRGRDMGGCMMGSGPGDLLDRIDGRLAFVKAELKITDAQSEAWSGLAETIRVNSETHNAMHREMMKEMHGGDLFGKSLPDRLIFQETHLETRLQQVKDVREDVEILYAVLDDEQKQSADEVVLPMMGMGCGRGRGMRHN